LQVRQAPDDVALRQPHRAQQFKILPLKACDLLRERPLIFQHRVLAPLTYIAYAPSFPHGFVSPR
jgi:hypothetical protein